MTVKIVTDSSSDVSLELAQQLGISIVPLYVRFGDEVYRDQVDISADEFYQKLAASPVHPTTAAPSPGDFTKVYKKLAQEADEILSIHISSKVSATYNAALQGRETLGKTGPHIEVIDSHLVSAALGLVAIGMAKIAETGEELSQVVEKVHQYIPEIRVMCLLDTLKYIARGGRLGKAASLLKAMLNVKPLLTFRNGEVHPVGLVRNRGKGLNRLCEFVKSTLNVQDLAIAHSVNPGEINALRERVSSFLPQLKPRILRLGPALGTHGGPGTLIVALRGGKSNNTLGTIQR